MPRITYVAPEMGALTSTFIYREIQAIRQMGGDVCILSTRHPTSKVISSEAKPFVAETVYIYELGLARLIKEMLLCFLRRPGACAKVKLLAIRDMFLAPATAPMDRVKLFWHFMLGCVAANYIAKQGTQHVHAHFAHVPASIAMYGAMMAGVPFSVTAHANDIFQRGVALPEKARRSAFIACISEYNVRFLVARGCDPAKLCVIHCAIDPAEYPMRPPIQSGEVPVAFSVGRFVEKKGFEYLVEGVKLLRIQGVPVRCRIVGDGPLFAAIQTRIEEAGIQDSVELMGSQPQERVKELLEEADLFVLPCVAAADGDLDGIPVALMEAMAVGVPVVSTSVSGIPELIEDGVNGKLAAPNDPTSLAAAMRALIEDTGRTQAMIMRARQTIESKFELHRNARMLLGKIEASTRMYS